MTTTPTEPQATTPSRIGDWIAISRKCADHPVVGMGQPVKAADATRGSFSRYEAWHFLLFEAAWKIKEIDNKGRIVKLRKGELMAAASWLADCWNWSAETVRWFLTRLEREGMVKSVEPMVLTPSAPQAKHQAKHQAITGKNPKRRTNLVRVLSICNYELYQTIYELDKLINPNREVNSPQAKPQALPQQSNKDIIITNTHAHTRGVDDIKRFNAEIENAVGPALADKNFYGSLLDTRIAQGWVQQGCDMLLDVLPTLRRLGADQLEKSGPNSIKSWKFFNDAVLKSKANRLRKPSKSSTVSSEEAASRKRNEELRRAKALGIEVVS